MKTIITFLCVLCIVSCATDDPIPETEVMEVEEQMEVEEANLVFDGDVELVTQQEVEEFGAIGYTEITGNLLLSTQFENPNPITSLSSLFTLEVVGGDLSLNPAYDITSLDGLHNLTSVTGALTLYGNPNITSLEAFSSINSTVTSLVIFTFREIETLNGLEGISIASGGSLIIEGNDKLINLDAIQDGIPPIMDAIKFEELILQCGPFLGCGGVLDVQPFTSLAFLSNVTEVEWLRIKGFQGTSLAGLENITAINRLTVWSSPNLINLQELSNVTNDLYATAIFENDQLESLDGLENIPLITRSFQANTNPSLTDYCAVQASLSGISGGDTFNIIGNAYNPSQQGIMDGNCSI